MRLIVMIAIAGLGACTEFPALDGTIDAAAKSADFPTLQPLEPLLALVDQGSAQINPANVTSFAGRINTLRARASRLRGPVIDATTRAKMQRGVAVPAAIR